MKFGIGGVRPGWGGIGFRWAIRIVAFVDALARPARFVVLLGQRYGMIGVPPLVERVALGVLLGDEAFDVDWLRAGLEPRGAAAVILPDVNRTIRFDLYPRARRGKHLIGNFLTS